jgi:hypothetical protein
MLMTRSLLACFALLAAGAASAQILECIDAKGNRTIAQFCPPGTVKETRLMKSGAGGTPGASSAASPAAATAGKTTADKEVEFRKRALERQEAEAKAEKERADAQLAERNCQDARAQLRQLEEGVRIMRIDPATGNRSYLEDTQRPAETARAREAVQSWCKK